MLVHPNIMKNRRSISCLLIAAIGLTTLSACEKRCKPCYRTTRIESPSGYSTEDHAYDELDPNHCYEDYKAIDSKRDDVFYDAASQTTYTTSYYCQ